VPKLRSLPFETAMIERHCRRDTAVEEALMRREKARIRVPASSPAAKIRVGKVRNDPGFGKHNDPGLGKRAIGTVKICESSIP
jgi:hypothetical protein